MGEFEEFGPTGAAFWRAAHQDYEWDAVDEAGLALYCHSLDHLAAMVVILARTAPLVKGSRNQPRANPLLSEYRKHEAEARRQFAALKLPVKEAAALQVRAANIVSLNATKAVNARWARRKASAT